MFEMEAKRRRWRQKSTDGGEHEWREKGDWDRTTNKLHKQFHVDNFFCELTLFRVVHPAHSAHCIQYTLTYLRYNLMAMRVHQGIGIEQVNMQ